MHGDELLRQRKRAQRKAEGLRTMNINARLTELEGEYESGKEKLVALDAQRADLIRSMIRLEGAMTLLREQGAGEPLVAVAQ